jgi:hypothetical protein
MTFQERHDQRGSADIRPEVALEHTTEVTERTGLTQDTLVWLVSGGIQTHKRRLEILSDHRPRIVASHQGRAECLDAVDTKISYYSRLEGEGS